MSLFIHYYHFTHLLFIWPQRSTRQEQQSEVDMLPSRIGLAYRHMKSSPPPPPAWQEGLKSFHDRTVTVYQNRVVRLWSWVSLGVTFCALSLSPSLILIWCFALIQRVEVVLCIAVSLSARSQGIVHFCKSQIRRVSLPLDSVKWRFTKVTSYNG